MIRVLLQVDWLKGWLCKRPLLLGFAFLICLWGIAKFFFPAPALLEDVKVVETLKTSLTSLTKTAPFIGMVRAHHATTLAAKSSGILTNLLPAGKWVEKGTLPAKIDNPDIEKTYELSIAFEKIAHDQYDRLFKLHRTGTSSMSTLEEKKNAWIAAQKSLAEAKIALDKIHLVAPFDCTVGVFKVREGGYVKEGDFIVSLYDKASIIVEFDIPASLLSSNMKPQSVRIKGDYYPITHIQYLVDEETHMCPAYIEYPCLDCLIGMPIDLELILEKHDQTIVIPFEALVFQSNQPYVYVVEEGKALLKKVTLGLQEKDQIEITEGLSVGEQVIIKGHSRLYPEATVRVYEETPSLVTTP